MQWPWRKPRTLKIRTEYGDLEVPTTMSNEDITALRRKFAKEQDDARKETRA
jgi:hypothetical protein